MASANAPGPPQAEYGADEVSALVLDPGYSLIRAGFAGEDAPKSVVPTYYGLLDSSGSNSNKGYNGTNLIFGENGIHLPRGNFEIRNPMSKDGVVEDWDVAAKQWEYAITSRLTGRKGTPPSRNGLNDRTQAEKNEAAEAGTDGDVDMEDATENQEKPLEESPLLMAEPGWNPAKNREKAIELAMEDWGTPAFYLARNGVLSAFASGKASALVIDIGAANVSVTPVYDGMMLKKGTVKSPLAGNHISTQLRALFSQHSPPINLVPHYLVSSKTPVDANTPAAATYRSFATQPALSFRALQEERVLTEFKEACVQVWNPTRHMGASLGNATEFLKSSENGRPFEMPDGWNDIFGVERYKAAESLFDEKAVVSDVAWWNAADTTGEEKMSLTHAMTIPGLIQAALGPLDVDVKSALLANVVVTGGTSLVQGMTDRIQHEIMTMFPGARVRLQAPGNLVERRFAGWIGGSILASLGTFHQLWVSKKEYEESGAGIVERRCK